VLEDGTVYSFVSQQRIPDLIHVVGGAECEGGVVFWTVDTSVDIVILKPDESVALATD
jgi:hypothetical protein